MNWITIIWSMVASACLTLAAMNVLVWLNRRTARANLLFSMMAAATACVAFFELSMMLAETPEAYGRFMRWIQLPLWMVVVSLVLFMRQYLHAGRPWLAWTVCGMRTLSLVLNFVFTPNLHYREIGSLHHLRFLGETISVARGVPNPWMLTAQASTLLLVIFVIDVAVTVHRRGGSRSAVVMSSSIIFFVVASMIQAALVFWWRVPMPITISFFSLGVVAATAFEMSLDVQRAAQLSDALRESESRLRDITFSMGDWVWEVDEKGVYTYSSAKGKELFGHIIGKTPFDLMPQDEAKRVSTRFAEIAAEKAPIKDLENWNVGKNGERICLLTNGVPILDEAGNLKGYRGVDKDITERKSMEERLQASEEKFREFFKNTPDYCYIISPEGTILNINSSALRALGYEREELIGKPVSMIYASESSIKMKELFDQWGVSGQIRNEEMVIITKQGEKHTILLNVGAVRDKDGTIIYSTSVQTDITERKRAEEALKENETAIRNSKKDLQRLAGKLISAQEEELRRLSRELHDDLTQRLAVLAIEAGKLELDLNKMPENSPETVHTVAQIKDQLIKVSEDVHTISRQLHPTILDDLGLVRAIDSECSAVMGRYPARITFRHENIPDEIADDIALCLYRIVQEGLRNIAAHSGAKHCEIMLKGDDHSLFLTVSDDGIGFDPLEVRSMSGLGLSSMRERMLLIQGDFTIRSQPGKGTMIKVSVPLAGGDA